MSVTEGQRSVLQKKWLTMDILKSNDIYIRRAVLCSGYKACCRCIWPFLSYRIHLRKLADASRNPEREAESQSLPRDTGILLPLLRPRCVASL